MTALALSLVLLTQDPAQVFERRALPIFKSPNPSSRVDCHLSGGDLKNYVHPTHEKTFLSLRDQGMVDEENAGAALISEKVRKAEVEAFTEWIKACAADPKLREAPKLAASEFARPKRPDEVIRHNRVDRVLASSERNV